MNIFKYLKSNSIQLYSYRIWPSAIPPMILQMQGMVIFPMLASLNNSAFDRHLLALSARRYHTERQKV